MSIKVIPKGKRYLMLRLGVGLIYSEKNGGMVLKDQTAWHKISGIWINTNRGCVWFKFRRNQFKW